MLIDIDNISKKCSEKGLSIAQLERKSGLGNGTIGKWKSVLPRIDNVLAVADVLGCTVDELIKEEP